MKPIIGVIGGSTCTTTEAALADETGRLLAERGAVLVCGGLSGVMEAAAKGAKANGGMTVGILPGADPAAANPYIDVLVAIGGGVGTLSEIALAQRIGKPVVGLHDSFRNAVDIPRVQTAAAAVAWALEWAQKGMV